MSSVVKGIGAHVPARALPAIEGGRPTRTEFLPFGQPRLDDDEVDAVTGVLRSGWLTTGPVSMQFEKEFATYVDARHAIALSSCTAALHLGLLLANVGAGDEVIVPSLTFAATANVVELTGARPIFADVDPDTLCLAPAAIQAAISPRTKAIVPVHFGGMAADLAEIDAIARRHGLAVVEDAAHAVGTRYRGRPIGSGPNAACFSFYANKNLTTGEGGMITVQDDALADVLRVQRMHGLNKDAWKRFSANSVGHSVVEREGFKYNLTDVLAAIGRAQLRKLEPGIERRHAYARRYDDALRELPIRLPRRPNSDSDRHSLYLYTLTLDLDRYRVDRDVILRALQAENIGAAVHYIPVHEHPYYRERYPEVVGTLPITEAIGRSILSLPLTPYLSSEEADDVIAATRKVLGFYASD